MKGVSSLHSFRQQNFPRLAAVLLSPLGQRLVEHCWLGWRSVLVGRIILSAKPLVVNVKNRCGILQIKKRFTRESAFEAIFRYATLQNLPSADFYLKRGKNSFPCGKPRFSRSVCGKRS
jgi:hypothetical protein